MPEDKIRITEALIDEALGANRFSVPGNIRRQLAAELDKKINPPAWRVVTSPGRSLPIIKFRNTGIELHVFSGTASGDAAHRLNVAELIVGVLNERGLEVA